MPIITADQIAGADMSMFCPIGNNNSVTLISQSHHSLCIGSNKITYDPITVGACIRNEQTIKRYRMDLDEIIAAAKDAVDNHGFKALVLQSGEDYWYDDAKLELHCCVLRLLMKRFLMNCVPIPI